MFVNFIKFAVVKSYKCNEMLIRIGMAAKQNCSIIEEKFGGA